MTRITVFIVLVLFGILDTGYLFSRHFSKKPVICPLNHDCTVVTQSKWSRVFGIRTEVLGLTYYCMLLITVLLIQYMPSVFYGNPYTYVLGMISGGMLFSLYFVSIQLFVIKDYCFYCMASALLNVLLLVTTIAMYSA